MKKDNQTGFAALRSRAEKILKNRPLTPGDSPLEADLLKLIHELEVHQIELELQKEELQRTNEKLSRSVDEKYLKLYNCAPTGYFSLTIDGEITEVNNCGATMLCKTASLLVNSRFGFFVSEEFRQVFSDFLDIIFKRNEKASCEIELIGD